MYNEVQRWLDDVDFDYFAASEPEAPPTQPMMDKDIVDLVHVENDASQEEFEDEEDENPFATMIKNTTEFLAIIDQQ